MTIPSCDSAIVAGGAVVASCACCGSCKILADDPPRVAKIRRRLEMLTQIAKNRFYQAIFTSGSLSEGILPRDLVAPPADRAAQALAFLLSRKPPAVV